MGSKTYMNTSLNFSKTMLSANPTYQLPVAASLKANLYLRPSSYSSGWTFKSLHFLEVDDQVDLLKLLLFGAPFEKHSLPSFGSCHKSYLEVSNSVETSFTSSIV